VKIAIVGLGSVGRRHLRNLATLGHTGCVLLRSGRSTLPDPDPQGFPVVTDIEAALRLRPDAAVIATPTSLHLDSAIPLARAGCHLLLEKPVSHSLDRTDTLREAARESGARVMVAFQYRHHPGLQAVRRWVADGAIGRVVSAHAHYGDYLPAWHPWEDYRQSYSARADLGGGAALTLCHPLDYLAWMIGPVARVTATFGYQGGLDIDVEDTVEALLEFSGGATASVHLDFVQRPPAHTLSMVGTEGTATWDQSDGVARIYRTASGQWEVVQAPAGFDRNDMFLAQMQSFLDVCAGTRAAGPTLDEGLHVLNIALALRESAGSGRRTDIRRACWA